MPRIESLKCPDCSAPIHTIPGHRYFRCKSCGKTLDIRWERNNTAYLTIEVIDQVTPDVNEGVLETQRLLSNMEIQFNSIDPVSEKPSPQRTRSGVDILTSVVRAVLIMIVSAAIVFYGLYWIQDYSRLTAFLLGIIVMIASISYIIWKVLKKLNNSRSAS